MTDTITAQGKKEEEETNCVICGDYMSDVDIDDYKEGCNDICDKCCSREEKEEEEEVNECIGCGSKMGECPVFSCCGRMKILNEKKWTGEDKLRGSCEGCTDFCESCYDKYQEDPEWENFKWEYLGLTTEKEIKEEEVEEEEEE